jgi:hypothetical protein
MQKLKLKSRYKFCESGNSSHTKHSKIGFAIFGFFCDFIWILQVAAKTLKGVKKPFCEQAPGKIEKLTVMLLVCANVALGTLQCGPRAWGWHGQGESR